MKQRMLLDISAPQQEQPYPLPANWCWTTVGAINGYSGKSVDPSRHPDSLFELYSVPSSSEGVPEIVAGNVIGSTKNVVKRGDVLLCKINPRINRVWQVTEFTGHEALASSEWIVIRNATIDSDYMEYWLRSPCFREYMLSNVSGVGGSLMRARPKHVRTYPVPLPPLSEQVRIAERLDSVFARLDEAKEKVESVLDDAEVRQSALLRRAFTGELTERWRKEHGSGPKDWAMVTFSDCVREMRNGTARRKGEDGTARVVLRLADIQGDRINDQRTRKIRLPDSEYEKYLLAEDDVLMVRVNGSKDIVGRQLLVPENDGWAFCDHLIRVRYRANILPDYMVLFSKSEQYREYVSDNVVSSAGQNTISRKGMQALIVPIPTVDEQREIVRVLWNALHREQGVRDAAEETLKHIDVMKKSILARAFRGELGTNDPAEKAWNGC